jgi:hypothetical protein
MDLDTGTLVATLTINLFVGLATFGIIEGSKV